MRAIDIIAKKRDGQALTKQEITWFIDTYTKDSLPDYQASALLMAILLRGMTPEEVTYLTLAMADSGERLDLSDLADYVVDKHSSGGVGDKTTLVVGPLVAACGVPVAKMSGRGLGFTGGTLDKLDSIPGFNSSLTEDQFRAQVKSIGFALAGQSHDLAPADGKLYALRDVTGTVPSLPLIASSIMSKKIASGANGIVLDVKTGSGAFMKDMGEAYELAKLMVQIGHGVGRQVIALVSDMNQPLGEAVGNALEVEEALQTLHGAGPKDFQEHCLETAAHMLRLAGRGKRWSSLMDARNDLERQLASGAAFAKFREMIAAQGGDVSVIDDPSKLPQASVVEDIYSQHSGYVEQVDALMVAQAAFELGAGREKKGDPIDPAVGVRVYPKVGDRIHEGDKLATIYASSPYTLATCRGYLRRAFRFNEQEVAPLPLFYDVVGLED